MDLKERTFRLKQRLKLAEKEQFACSNERRAIRKKLYIWIVIHYIACICNAVTFMISIPMMVYLIGPLGLFPAVTLMVYVYSLAFGKQECPATAYENKLRTRLGLPTITSFVKHYFMRA